jgi:hypothetical protein
MLEMEIQVISWVIHMFAHGLVSHLLIANRPDSSMSKCAVRPPTDRTPGCLEVTSRTHCGQKCKL